MIHLRRLLLLLALPTACVRQPDPAASRPDGGGATAAGTAQAAPTLAPDDRTRLAESFRLAGAIGESVWPGWSNAPFAVLLVTPEHEFLLRHPHPPSGFASAGLDPVLRTEVLVRARTFSPGLLATFPLAGIPTIVIGQPASTGKSSTEWVLTVLHEHFHQLQMSRAGYFAGVDSLGLSRGDETGMWMLNYAFPYAADSVQASFAALARALGSGLAAADPVARQASWQAVLHSRARLAEVLPADDLRYLRFQVWQEGVALYTELQVARWAHAHHEPGREFRALPDFTPFGAIADSIEAGIRGSLNGNPLGDHGRIAFYPVGAATALLLDGVAPGWRSRYLESGYTLDGLAGAAQGSTHRERQGEPHEARGAPAYDI